MEYIEGKPIAGPVPVEQACAYGIQICEALHAAHKNGIVHRDLKPANILLTKQGVKLLDFGLAKLTSGNSGVMVAPTATMGEQATVAALTGVHTVVGTPQYMAPEQIEARDVDARTDIFAFGCVLYELLTGQRAFDGKTSSSIMAAVLATKPRPIEELVPLTPPALERIVARCLAKDPEDRWQTARDVAAELQWVGQGGSKVGLPAVVTGRRRTREGAAWAACAMAVLSCRRVRCRLGETGARASRGRALPAVVAAGHAESQPACRVPGWPAHRICRRRRRQAAHLGACARCARGPRIARDRGRAAPVLVTRQPLPRVHVGRRAEESGHCRRAADHDRRGAKWRRWQLERRGRNPVRRTFGRSVVARPGRRWQAAARRVWKGQGVGHARRRLAGVPPGREAFPIHPGRLV